MPSKTGIARSEECAPRRLRALLELRCEAFNTFNSRNLGQPDGHITDGTFGRIISSGQARNLQIDVRLSF